MRRALLIALAVIVAAGLAGYAMRGSIAIALMKVVAGRAITADPVDELPDGLTVVLCGAGSPLADPQRSGPCVAVVAGKQLYEVDAGDGAGRNLTRLGLPPGRVAALFLTHFHSDHIDGLGEL